MRKLLWMVMLLVSQATHPIIGSEAEFQDGFYLAGSVGSSWAQSAWSGLGSIVLIDDINDTNGFFQSWSPSGEFHDDTCKIMGSLALGYQLVDSRLYLGGQINYTVRSKQHFTLGDIRIYNHLAMEGLPMFSTVSGSSNVQSKVSLALNEFDVDLKPGILILKNLLLYSRAGVVFTRLNIKSSGVWTEMNTENGTVLTATDASYHSQNKVGFRAGAGTEYLISQHIGISLDYIWSFYGKIRNFIQGENSGFFDFNQLYGVSAPEVKITSHTLMGGIVFHF